MITLLGCDKDQRGQAVFSNPTGFTQLKVNGEEFEVGAEVAISVDTGKQLEVKLTCDDIPSRELSLSGIAEISDPATGVIHNSTSGKASKSKGKLSITYSFDKVTDVSGRLHFTAISPRGGTLFSCPVNISSALD